MSSRRSSSLALAQLIRLPAVFTALSDIAMSAAVAWSSGASFSWVTCSLILLVSACVYCAGMVLNDVADVQIDRRERPFRPIPSGRIRGGTALTLGGVLLLIGLAVSAAERSQGSHTLLTCSGLVVAVVAYDFIHLRWLRLLLMPTCRFLNVLLGFSAADLESVPWSIRIYLAGIVAVYILGITLFARNEAVESNPRTLLIAGLFMLGALGVSLAVPVVVAGAKPAFSFPYLILLLAWMIAIPGVRTLKNPDSRHVQRTVRVALRGIIILDAALACAVAGTAGLVILLLLVPNWYTGRWMSST